MSSHSKSSVPTSPKTLMTSSGGQATAAIVATVEGYGDLDVGLADASPSPSLPAPTPPTLPRSINATSVPYARKPVEMGFTYSHSMQTDALPFS